MYPVFCELCGEEVAHYRCEICRRYVCRKHYDSVRRRCSVCVDSECEVCFNFLSVGRCIMCGRKVCGSCSIDIDGVRRVCTYCLIRSSIQRVSKEPGDEFETE